MDFTKLTGYLNTLEEKYSVHGLDIKITKEHDTVYRYMTGHSDHDGKVPVSEGDLYDIFSCTKVITMTGVMQLVEQGKIDLFAPLETYLPEFASMQYASDFKVGQFPFSWPTEESALLPAQNKIHIHQLMSMTSGMSYDVAAKPIREVVNATNGEANTRQIVAAMAKMPLLFEPGTHYSYALGHDVLAAVIEVVTGMTFGEYMKKNVFVPLGITEMYYQIPESEKHRLSAQYAKDWNTGEIKPDKSMIYRITRNYESGGAGLAATVNEYSKVIEALANGGTGSNGSQILTPNAISTMSRNWLTDVQMSDFSRTGKAGYGYGLGVRTLIDGTKSKSPVGEFGWDGAAGAFSLVDPVNHVSIFYTHEILGMMEAYSEIHPTIRDMAYEAMEL